MIPIKRLEIVVDAPNSERVLALLTEHGLVGWTLLRGASGAGERGPRFGDEITGVSSNHLIIAACPEEVVEGLLEDLRTLLTRIGGMCLMSDATWLRH